MDRSTIGEEFLKGFGCKGGGAESVVTGEDIDVADGLIPVLMEHGGVPATTPGGGDHLFDEFEFELGGWSVVFDVVLKDGIEAFLIFGKDERRLGVGTVFEAIETIAKLTFDCDWATGFTAIDACGFTLFFGSHAALALAASGRLSRFLRHEDRPPAGTYKVDASAQPG
jgi:hypothetical protein